MLAHVRVSALRKVGAGTGTTVPDLVWSPDRSRYSGTVALGTGYDQQACYLARSLEVLGERWTLLIVRDCFLGVRRFTDLRDHLDISRAVLSQRLQQLVDAGVLERADAGAHAEYALTDAGRELWPVVLGLARWGERHVPGDHPARRFVHAGCDADLDDAGRCPRCGTVPDPADVETRPGGESRRTDRVTRALREPHRMLTPI